MVPGALGVGFLAVRGAGDLAKQSHPSCLSWGVQEVLGHKDG